MNNFFKYSLYTILSILWGVILYICFSLYINNSYSFDENKDKYNYDSPFFNNYVSLNISMGNCNIILEKNYALIQESPMKHDSKTLDEILYNAQHCSLLNKDVIFLTNIKKHNLAFPSSNEQEQILLIMKYWFFIDKKDLSILTNSWTSSQGIFLKQQVQ